MTLAIARPLELVTASRYANPANDADILPDVYGDLRDVAGLRGTIPAVCIDTVNFVYAAAGHAVQSIDAVFDEDVLLTAAVDYTANVSFDYESQGLIAVIDLVAPPTGQISWRGRGKVSGSLITDAVAQIQDLLTTRGGFASTDFNTGSLAEATAAITREGYLPGWVIQDTREVGAWLTEMLFNVMGRWRVGGDGRLEILVDEGTVPLPLAAHVVAARDCVQGEDGVEFLGDYQAIVNAVTGLYQWNWAVEQPASISSGESGISLNAYGETRKLITLRGLRRLADVETWLVTLFTRLNYRNRVEGALVRFAVDGPRLASITPGDFISLSWDWGPTRESGNLYRNEILQVLGLGHEPGAARLRTNVLAMDTGEYLTDDDGDRVLTLQP